jgi:pimeloyl-ACP methyl ester carboxylesterase
MSDIRTGTVISADGTVIGFDQSGAGPAVILVQGALMNRSDPVMTGIAAGLSRWFTVLNYDRRGRGGSGDTQPYAVEREAEDLDALIAAGGGQAAVFGGSSGAGLVLRAAARNPAITRLALWEPPYHVDDSAPRTLAYEAFVMGPGNELPVGLLAGITQPTLVPSGGASPAWMGRAGKAVASAIPGAVHRVPEGQPHYGAPEAIVPELLEFLITA